MVFIDLKKAFDRAEWKNIMDILRWNGVDDWEKKVIKKKYTRR